MSARRLVGEVKEATASTSVLRLASLAAGLWNDDGRTSVASEHEITHVRRA